MKIVIGELRDGIKQIIRRIRKLRQDNKINEEKIKAMEQKINDYRQAIRRLSNGKNDNTRND